MANASTIELAAMRRALELARLGPAYGPNPQVGCVLLDASGRIVGEGYHRGAGTPHAEAAAIQDAAGRNLTGGTAVVTLEPCRHHGRTPPCTDALAATGVVRVVYGSSDPNPAAGGGGAVLAERGIDVVGGVLRDQCDAHIRRWLIAVTHRRPHVTLKLACSLDGFIAAADGTSHWITGEVARDHAHRYRAEMDAIAVGTGTLLADDPSLTARPRGQLATHQPIRVVIGDRPIPPDAKIRQARGEVRHLPGHDLAATIASLFDDGVTRLLVEGGATLAGAVCRADLVDEYHAYIAPILLGEGVPAVAPFGVRTLADAPRLTTREVTRLGEDTFIRLEREVMPCSPG